MPKTSGLARCAPSRVFFAPFRKNSLHFKSPPLHSEKVRSTSRVVRSTPKKFAPSQVVFAPLRKNSLHFKSSSLHSEKIRSISRFLRSIPETIAPSRQSSLHFV